MNERIKELAEQARYDARNETHYLERVHNREFTFDEYQEIYDKKFAELIVRECVEVCELWNTTPGSKLAKEIEEHFGV